MGTCWNFSCATSSLCPSRMAMLKFASWWPLKQEYQIYKNNTLGQTTTQNNAQIKLYTCMVSWYHGLLSLGNLGLASVWILSFELLYPNLDYGFGIRIRIRSTASVKKIFKHFSFFIFTFSHEKNSCFSAA
jgi:hypothetical protein